MEATSDYRQYYTARRKTMAKKLNQRILRLNHLIPLHLKDQHRRNPIRVLHPRNQSRDSSILRRPVERRGKQKQILISIQRSDAVVFNFKMKPTLEAPCTYPHLKNIPSFQMASSKTSKRQYATECRGWQSCGPTA